MLRAPHRLTKDKEFNYVFTKGRSSYDNILGVKTALNSLKSNRFGILVGVKISKKSVDRNKIKRQIREAIKKEFPSLKLGWDIVIIALPAIKDKTSQDIINSLNFHFTKLRLR